jgi:peptidoglycan/LPS O-acetylase OafA/YrhL
MSAHVAFAEPGGRDKGRSPEGGAPAPAGDVKLRLVYLDGLRAVAAGYVVMFHAVPGFAGHELTGVWRVLRRAFAFGHEAVAIFIVLSGYCLMLPVVRQRPERLSVELGRFFKRRALRILPPYFAALAGSIGLIASFGALRTRSGTIWDDSLPGLDAGAILSHLFVVHNWSPTWGYQINGPLWSVASEWQIYFFFPLVLLPVWRRFGMLAALVLAAVLGFAPLLLWQGPAHVAIPWYLLLFAFGMVAAAVGFAPDALATRLRAHVRWGYGCAGLWIGCFTFSMGAPQVWFSNKPLVDVLVGLFTMTLLIHLTHSAATGVPSRVLAVLESRPLVALGHFSYSLYLTHLPVLALCYFFLRDFGWSVGVRSLALLGAGSVLSLVVAYGFHLLVERPFLLRRPG